MASSGKFVTERRQTGSTIKCSLGDPAKIPYQMFIILYLASF
jgi:hypothetical protein